jgi:Concanavalin A-like lectin/glucanases superfamily
MSKRQLLVAEVLMLFGGVAHASSYVTTVVSTNPIGYFRLEAASDTSQLHGYTSTFLGGATLTNLATHGAPVCIANNHAVVLDGSTGSVSTSLFGGVSTAGAVAAWVNLAVLPSVAGSIFYVAGESRFMNAFDLQFTTDNFVRFYVSDSSTSVGYQPNIATLVGQWHFVVATFDSSTNTENIYWDGQLVATTNNTVYPNLFGRSGRAAQFTIGESSFFTGRHFNGAIDEVAVWNYALTANQVAAIYSSASCATLSVYNPDQAITLVSGTSLNDAISNLERNLVNSGFSRRIEGAFAGESITIDDQGNKGANTKIVMIPYTNSQGVKTAWILAAVQNTDAGENVLLLLTPTIATTCNGCVGSPDPARPLKATMIRPLSVFDDFQAILQAIRSGGISYGIGYALGTFIARGLADWIMAPQIKAAYESQGYICVDPPWWMPIPKSIWYASTCARPVY